MFVTGIVPTSVDSIKWQDYRGSKCGMIVYYNTDPVSELPIREIPEELPSDIICDPHYETGTYGFYGCKHTKTRNSFIKNKYSYLFFMTKYAGTNVDFLDDLMITGFYRIKHTTDSQRLHIRYLDSYSCVNEDFCISFKAKEVCFFSVEEAFKLTPEVLKDWSCTSRITRQTKIVLEDNKTTELLNYFSKKENIIGKYIEETERLIPELSDYEEDEDDEE